LNIGISTYRQCKGISWPTLSMSTNVYRRQILNTQETQFYNVEISKQPAHDNYE